MDDLHLFLAHAIQLEKEAARHYESLTAMMKTGGNAEVAAFFAEMAGFSRAHLADAMARGGFRAVPQLAPQDYLWPDGISPETAGWEGVDAMMDTAAALELALAAERRGYAFYAGVAATTQNIRVKQMAAEFAAEEAEHVAELEKWVARCAN
ncbi:MAG: rubrerythrin [Zoogloea sp.]|nr:rubrerythrin [Zoogloea sp.]